MTRRSLAVGRIDPDVAAVSFNDLLTDCESDDTPLTVTTLVENTKYVVLATFGITKAVIGDGELRHIVPLGRGDFDNRVFITMFYRILD